MKVKVEVWLENHGFLVHKKGFWFNTALLPVMVAFMIFCFVMAIRTGLIG